jgi:hypothetical protein
MNDFGKGPTLKDSCPWLQDDATRRERILEVSERDSVIEGLPPFQEETRRRILRSLEAMSDPIEIGPQSEPAE